MIICEFDPLRAAERDTLLAEQLRSGSVSTDRQAFVPWLGRGLVDSRSPAAGALFVQPEIARANGSTARMGDLVEPEFLSWRATLRCSISIL
ncbi:hypothetical protein [Sphingopyxis sp. GC21]|uniref:hypothetical protein n=1 Tax=Sphingopyxis sp. GC21 TaxID=2933562 RepID=UPI0021E4C982|nr:hypothetical protein [Sphingopyxis sp. GC21]